MPFQIPKSCRHTQIGLWNWMDMKHSELWNTSAQIPLSTKASLETTLEACTMNPSMEGTYILWMFLGLTILARHLFPTVAHRCHLKTLKASLEPGSTAHLLSEPWSVKAGSRWRQSKGVNMNQYEPIWTNIIQYLSANIGNLFDWIGALDTATLVLMETLDWQAEKTMIKLTVTVSCVSTATVTEHVHAPWLYDFLRWF